MDKDTFSALAMAQQRQMYRIAVAYLGSSADAEDAMQDALLRAWHRRDTLREPAYFGTWLTRILINECKTKLRKRKRLSVMPELPALSAAAVDEQALALRQALFALPEKYRVPLMLHVLEGYTLAETASLMGVPLGTVKTRVARAKSKLEQEVTNDAP